MSRITALLVAAATMMGVASFAQADSTHLLMLGGGTNWAGFPTLGGATGGVALPNTEVAENGWTIHGSWQDLGFSEHGWNLGLTYGSQTGGKNGWEAGAALNSVSGGGSTEDGFSAHAKFRLAYPNSGMNHMGMALGLLYTTFSDSNFTWWGVYAAGSIPLSRMTSGPTPLLSGGIIWDTVDDDGFTVDEFNYFALLEIPLENRRSAFVVEWKSAFEFNDALFSAAFRHQFSPRFGAQAGITNAFSSTHLGGNESRLFVTARWGLGTR